MTALQPGACVASGQMIAARQDTYGNVHGQDEVGQTCVVPAQPRLMAPVLVLRASAGESGLLGFTFWLARAGDLDETGSNTE